jgi:hypothetical protein
MTDRVIQESPPPRRLLRSTGAIAAGFLSVAVLSLATDQVLHMLNIYPPWGEPMRDTDDNLLALFYRSGYAVIGGYVTARLAPAAPMRHVLILGCIGTLLSAVGVYAAITMDMGPAWYPIALVVSALPLTMIGGSLGESRQTEQRPHDVGGHMR